MIQSAISTKFAILFAALFTTSQAFSACDVSNQFYVFQDGFEGETTAATTKMLKTSASTTGAVTTKSLQVSGDLHDNKPQYATWKGLFPNLMYQANCDSSVDIAWHDATNGSINITQVDVDGNVKGSFKLTLKRDELPDETTGLLGFTRTPDGSYAVAYSKNEVYTYEEGNLVGAPVGKTENIGHYYLAKFDQTGNNIWTNHIYGYDHAKPNGRPYNPGSSATGRLEYDARTGALVYFIGANKRKGNTSIHQFATWGLYNTDGVYLSSFDDGPAKHNYEQRIFFDGDKTYFFGHQDSGPYGLYISWWRFLTTRSDESGKPTAMSKEPIQRGAAYAKYGTNFNRNITNHALGDIVNLGNGEFAVAYTRGKEADFHPNRGNYNVYFRHIDPSKDLQDFTQNKQLTNLPQIEGNDEQNGSARIAQFGDHFVVAWHNNQEDYALIGEYDIDANVIVAPRPIDGVLLNPMYGMITLPNGNVFWASSAKTGGSTLNLHWIKPTN